ncbi:MAG TPA: hypothetical protein VJN21_07475 [Candidatus Acidoferrales bacterium]|nr:hypothetical protein [Candidatus Acidoferrales bacterium]
MARNVWLAASGAVVSSVMTLACCLPFGFMAALGAAGAGVFLTRFRPWLLGLSVVLVGVGFYQQYHGPTCSLRRRRFNFVFLWAATIVVLLVLLFPQFIASVLAGASWGGLK